MSGARGQHVFDRVANARAATASMEKLTGRDG